MQPAMAMHPRPQPARLHIPPHLAQGPLDVPAMFSPGLPTAIHQGFPGYAHSAMQTPMQGGFFPTPMPGRPPMHRARSSVAHIMNAGMYPPAGMPLTPGGVPLTPLGPGIPALAPPMFPPNGPGGFIPKSRRTMSIGGPPKAVLGGPNKQQLPPPPPAPLPVKVKKAVVNIPKETIPGEDGAPSTRPDWAREPWTDPPEQPNPEAPELTTGYELDNDAWRYSLPNTVEVYLPGKRAWDKIKHQIIEEKLEKLGVERGSGSAIPHIHAPHARAASVSSPADPALLLFRLNKLHASQNISPNTSLTTSPQPPLSLSMSPSNLGPRFQAGRHGYSMSLAQPPSRSPASQFNPFGPDATLGSDQVLSAPEIAAASSDVIHTPQARVPIVAASLAPPSGSRPVSRPDFARGFGLDVPEEDEEAKAAAEAESQGQPMEESEADGHILTPTQEDGLQTEDMAVSFNDTLTDIAEDEEGGLTTAPQSRAHSRHVSRLSAALSLHEVGGPHGALVRAPRSSVGDDEVEVMDEEEAIAEWTGSEDLREEGESSADESIGEWSNPSDEERARQERAHRHALRRARQETPRRLPNFPRPPDEYDEDDVISNPSDEERLPHSAQYLHATHHSPGNGRPLPPLPHSRATSANYSYYDPALGHSRQPSEQIPYPASPSAALSLNPNAKPFSFGRPRLSGSFPSGTFGESPAVHNSSLGHSRESSMTKSLNVSAPAFTPGGINPNAPVFTPGGFNLAAAPFMPSGLKVTAPAFAPTALKPDAPVFTPGGLNAGASAFTPGGFTFKAPTGVPQLSFPSPKSARPLPTPPDTIGPVRASQGREKRQRRNSETMVGMDADDEAEPQDSMASFKFPTPDKSRHVTRRSGSEPTSPTAAHSRHGSALAGNVFSASGYTATWPRDAAVSEPAELGETVASSPLAQDVVILNSDEEPTPDGFSVPQPAKPKRTPLPLDFTHPVSTKTVPAGLFKALSSSAEDPARRGMRPRLGSDGFEHSPRPSLDDAHIMPISFARKPARMVTDPVFLSAAAQELDGTDKTIARLRAASMPGASHSPTSSASEVSIPPIQFEDRAAMRGFEQRLEDLLETKMGALREDLLEQNHTFGGTRVPSASNEAAIAEVVALIHSKLQHSIVKALEDSRLDGRGELDFELIKGIVDRGHERSRAALKNDLAEIARRLSSQPNVALPSSVLALEDIHNKTISAINRSTATLAERLDVLHTAQALTHVDRPSITADIVASLVPHFAALRTEPVDYDGLTHKLSQAVKPHITQLIDLASDKRETAGLIVEQLKPILSALSKPQAPLDTNALATQLTAEVRRVIGPIDAHEIKEQVSDLVVERLDSRLTVRDRAFNVDTVVARVTESLNSVLEPVCAVAAAVEKVSSEQQTLSADARGLVSSSAHMSAVVDELPKQLTEATETLKSVQAQLQAKASQGDENAVTVKSLAEVNSVVKDLQGGQHSLADQMAELANLQQDVIGGLNALPEVLVATTKVLDEAHEDMMTRERSYQRDLNEVRHILGQNAELQANLAKARSQHGQVRVEKDMLNERLVAAEAERDQLRAQVEEAQASSTSQATQLAATEARNQELERALEVLQERFKESDVAAKVQTDRLREFDEERKSWLSERDQLQSQAKEFELRAELMLRSKENAENMNAMLRSENTRLQAAGNSLDSLRQLSEQLQGLQAVQGASEQAELDELRRTREKTENEFAALQKRFKEQEARITNSERTAYTARQTLAQAQQRASEWEKKATAYDGERLTMRTRAEEAESARAQFEADLVEAQSRLEEKDAHDRLARDRESKLRDQVASLDGQLAKLKVATAKPTSVPSLNGHSATNGRGLAAPPSRGRAISPPDTVYGRSRSTTPVRGTPVIERESSVWDSMHAPQTRYPPTLGVKSARPSNYRAPSLHQAPRAPSPAASVVSVAPTLGEDGWWE